MTMNDDDLKRLARTTRYSIDEWERAREVIRATDQTMWEPLWANVVQMTYLAGSPANAARALVAGLREDLR